MTGGTDTPPGAAARPCPVCGKPSSAEFRPFCSKRCTDVDLHRWLAGAYAVPAEEPPEGFDADGEDGGSGGTGPRD